MKKYGMAIIFALLFVSCGNNANKNQANQQPQYYPTEIINRQTAVLKTSFPVTITGQQDIEIKPRIEGNILQIYVDEGSVVRKGEPLFRIDSPPAEHDLKTAQAWVNSIEAQVNTAQLDVERFRPLAEKGIVSNTHLQTYKNVLASTLANLSQAEASLENAKARMDWTTVTSPSDGLVGSIPYREGSLVNSGSVLTTIADISNVFVYFSINEKELISFLAELPGATQAEKIKNIGNVWLTLAGGDCYPYPGKISTIGGQVDVSTGSASFRANFPNPEGTLRSGFSGRITIPREIENAIVITQAATFQQQNKIMTYKVQGDSVVQVLINVLPIHGENHYIVTSGLDEGDRIVTEGIVTLAPGKRISME